MVESLIGVGIVVPDWAWQLTQAEIVSIRVSVKHLEALMKHGSRLPTKASNQVAFIRPALKVVKKFSSQLPQFTGA
jgi:hypothetical protein